ncbi:hypothetical protein C8F01DRAFT_1084507 [Mycena amicta]|nr:hypothetical protein C8F01DRAFT_1084507 [Mycena amicta]
MSYAKRPRRSKLTPAVHPERTTRNIKCIKCVLGPGSSIGSPPRSGLVVAARRVHLAHCLLPFATHRDPCISAIIDAHTPDSPKDGAQHPRHVRRPRHVFVVPHVAAISAPRTVTVASEGPLDRIASAIVLHTTHGSRFLHMWQLRTRRASWAPSSPHLHAANTKYPINLRGGDSGSPTPHTRTARTSRPSDPFDAPRDEALAVTQCTLRPTELLAFPLAAGGNSGSSVRTTSARRQARCRGRAHYRSNAKYTKASGYPWHLYAGY